MRTLINPLLIYTGTVFVIGLLEFYLSFALRKDLSADLVIHIIACLLAAKDFAKTQKRHATNLEKFIFSIGALISFAAFAALIMLGLITVIPGYDEMITELIKTIYWTLPIIAGFNILLSWLCFHFLVKHFVGRLPKP